MKEQGGLKADTKLTEVNPDLFQKFRFKAFIYPENLNPKNEEYERLVKKAFYDRAMLNPFVNKQAVTRDYLVEPEAKGEADKYMLTEEELAQQMTQQLPPEGGGMGSILPSDLLTAKV